MTKFRGVRLRGIPMVRALLIAFVLFASLEGRATEPVTIQVPPEGLRINVGGPAFRDELGRLWQGDTVKAPHSGSNYLETGNVVKTYDLLPIGLGPSIPDGTPEGIFLDSRWARDSDMIWKFSFPLYSHGMGVRVYLRVEDAYSVEDLPPPLPGSEWQPRYGLENRLSPTFMISRYLQDSQTNPFPFLVLRPARGTGIAGIEITPSRRLWPLPEVALRKRAIQSSTATSTSVASLAVDTNASSAALTKSELEPYWMVDLGKEHRADEVFIKSVAGKLKGAKVYFTKAPLQIAGTRKKSIAEIEAAGNRAIIVHSGAAAEEKKFNLKVTSPVPRGRYLLIQHVGTQQIQLFEVKVNSRPW